jgi:hypothetical protein
VRWVDGNWNILFHDGKSIYTRSLSLSQILSSPRQTLIAVDTLYLRFTFFSNTLIFLLQNQTRSFYSSSLFFQHQTIRSNEPFFANQTIVKMRYSGFLASAAVVALANAHTTIWNAFVDGVNQGVGNSAAGYIRSPPNNNPVKDIESSAMTCNVNNVATAKTIDVKAGSKVRKLNGFL